MQNGSAALKLISPNSRPHLRRLVTAALPLARMPRDEQEGERRGQERHQGHQVKGVDVAHHAGLALDLGRQAGLDVAVAEMAQRRRPGGDEVAA